MRKPGPPREIPPPLELECLKVLWKIGEGNVKEVRTVLSEQRDLAYTTVMTLLDRLVRRGSAVRRKAGRSFIYSPTVERESLRAAAVRQLVDSLFEGSPDALLEYLGSKPLPVAANLDHGYTRDTDQNETLDTALL
jgi:predicted transcriptional regulator